MAKVAEDGEPDIPLIAHTDGISPAAGRGTTAEQEQVLEHHAYRGAGRARDLRELVPLTIAQRVMVGQGGTFATRLRQVRPCWGWGTTTTGHARVGDHVVADRAEEGAGEPAVTAAADHKQVSARDRVEERLGCVALHGLAGDPHRRKVADALLVLEYAADARGEHAVHRRGRVGLGDALGAPGRPDGAGG